MGESGTPFSHSGSAHAEKLPDKIEKLLTHIGKMWSNEHRAYAQVSRLQSNLQLLYYQTGWKVPSDKKCLMG